MPGIGRTKIVHGYYRYTDIWFEWYGIVPRRALVADGFILTCRDICRHQALPNREDGYALKAILAHEPLVHPDHPLRLADKPGIELSIGGPADHTRRLSDH
jgi:hypothetical protein